MKRIMYIILLLAIAITGCEKDNKLALVKADAKAPVILLPTNASAIAVTVPDTSKVFKIKWNKADFGVKAVVNYVVQLDAVGKNFASPITLGNTNTDSLSMTIGGLNNNVLNALNLPANAKSDIEFRVVATLSNQNKVTSPAIKISVTTYKELAPERLFVPGAYQNWAPDNAPAIRLIESGKYEGYVYMGIGDYYKFTSAADWNHINYGDDGNGKLTTDGLAGGLKANAAGYYKFNVDTKNLSYSVTLVQSFGIIGSATPGAWDNSTAMAYDQTTGLWKVTTNLVAGAVKFRANNGWELNYGPENSNNLTGALKQTDDAVTITQAGSYTITLDFKQTAAQKYLYSIVKN